jgi:hypothetical protein
MRVIPTFSTGIELTVYDRQNGRVKPDETFTHARNRPRILAAHRTRAFRARRFWQWNSRGGNGFAQQ